jgi:NitT/TauT family transport system ATP-binding protein
MSAGAGRIEAEGVCLSYGDETVLGGVDLTVAGGQVLAILGPSGVGKTTLLSVLAGLTRPNAGGIVSTFQRSAVVFQDPLLLPWRTARGNVAFGLAGLSLSREERLQSADAMLERVGLAGEADKYPHQLSGGMRKRVALARALAVEPDLLLIDEAFAALDEGLKRQMQQLVRSVVETRGTAVVAVTHDLSEAIRLADEIFVVSGRPGRITGRAPIERAAPLRDEGFVAAEIRRLSALPGFVALFGGAAG